MLHNEPAAGSGSRQGGVGRCKGGEVSRAACGRGVLIPCLVYHCSALAGCYHGCVELGAEVRAA